MKKILSGSLLLILVAAAAFILGAYYDRGKKINTGTVSMMEDSWDQTEPQSPNKTFPLEKYALNKLNYEQATASQIQLEKLVADEPEYWSVIFTYTPEGKKMSGLMNIPKNKPEGSIVMLRGWAPSLNYQSGTGTKNAAAYYASQGNYMTVAPDFFGYGLSDPEPEDGWQARFEKPLLVMDLIKSLEAGDISCAEKDQTAPKSNLPNDSLASSSTTSNTAAKSKNDEIWAEICNPINLAKIKTPPEKLGLWGHSNGGQIALSVLEVMKEPMPTTLWAAVTAPFPYSVLFFTDEEDDEGKGMRKWLAQFEKDYDVFDFTVTKNLAQIAAKTPIQLHHGTADEAALFSWAQEFKAKVEAENKSRPAAERFDFQLFSYPAADHNLRPGWDNVVKRDVDFFKQNLLEK